MDNVIIIGAGLAGLTCARQLQRQGLTVTVLDKSRGLGGRLATRRLENQALDHGVPFFYDQGPHSHRLMEELGKRIQPCTGQFYEGFPHGTVVPSPPAFFAPEGMTAIAKYLAQNLTIHRNQQAIALDRSGNQWQITTATGQEFTTQGLILAMPAPQALALLHTLPPAIAPPSWLESLAAVTFFPCITVMVGYAAPLRPHLDQVLPQWQSLHLPDHPCLQRLIWEQRKRPQGEAATVVIQGNPSWSHPHAQGEMALAQAAAPELIQAAQKILQVGEPPQWQSVQRWRYAIADQWLPQDFLWQRDQNLGICGDWCGGNNLESALKSGQTLARQAIAP